MGIGPTVSRLAAALACGLALTACAVSPKPLKPDELNTISQDNLARVTAGQEPIYGTVSLHEAMARALKYSLDYKVEVMQQALRSAELRLTHFNMLPNAVVNSGYSARDNVLSSGEFNIKTGVETEPTTTSTERKLGNADVNFSWNILDFGLSYVRARQAADRVLIAEEAKRRVVQRIVEDVRTAYWRAVSADRLMRKLSALESRTRAALANARKLSANGDTSPMTSLTYERELVEIQRTAQELQRELSTSKTQLAALMNLPPDVPFELASDSATVTTPILQIDADEMIHVALVNRPELRENIYQRRINEDEAHAALLELLPGIQLYGGDNFDSNKYLEHNRWVSWGAKASWNLLKVFQYPAKSNVIDAQDELLKTRALALTMAIMTQVHVSRIRYVYVARELQSARDYFDVQQRLVKQIRAEAAAERVAEQTLIREELNLLVAEARRDIAFAAVQNAYANIFASVGLDPYGPQTDLNLSVKDVESQLESLWLERGEFGSNGRIVLAH